MKTYKMVTAEDPETLEQEINALAKSGYIVEPISIGGIPSVLMSMEKRDSMVMFDIKKKFILKGRQYRPGESVTMWQQDYLKYVEGQYDDFVELKPL